MDVVHAMNLLALALNDSENEALACELVPARLPADLERLAARIAQGRHSQV